MKIKRKTVCEIKKLGKRCTLIAEDERKTVKEKFDVVINEREKVLQEFKKGVRINAMVISRQTIADADVVVTTKPGENSDIFLGEGGLDSVLYTVALSGGM